MLMQNDLMEEMVQHKHKKEERLKAVKQSLKAKEEEYFALEVQMLLVDLLLCRSVEEEMLSTLLYYCAFHACAGCPIGFASTH